MKKILDFKTFEKYVNLAKDFNTLSLNLYHNTMCGIDLDKLYGEELDKMVPDEAIINLLTEIFDDEDYILSDWCYTYDFGEIAYEDSSFKSLEDIYNELTN